MQRLNRPWFTGAALGLAILLRVLGFLQPHLMTLDEALYSALGFQLRHYPTNYSGQILFTIADRYWSPHEMEYLNRPLFKHPPLYPMALALSYLLFGSHIFAALLPSLAAWAGICLLVRKIAQTIWNPRAGNIAFLLCLMDPMGWILSVKIYSECLLVALALGALWIYLKDLDADKGFSCGMILGLAAMVKYSAFVYLAIFLLHLAFLHRYKKGLFLLGGFSSVCAPWIFAQVYVYGGNLWDMLQKDFFIPGTFFIQCLLLLALGYFLLQPLLLYLQKYGFWDRPWGIRLLRWVPMGLFLATAVLALSRTGAQPFAWSSLPASSFMRDFPVRSGFYASQALLYLPFLAAVPLAPLFLFPSRDTAKGILLLGLVAIYYAIASFWQNPQIRYLYPIVPVLIVLAAGAWEGAQRWTRGLPKQHRVICTAVLSLIALFFLIKTLRNDWFFAVIHQGGRF